jgi:hypothetical protein
MIQYDDKIRTRTSFAHPLEFGKILLERQSLFSFSTFENNEVREIFFQTKQVGIWRYNAENLLESFQLFGFDDVEPVVDAPLTYDSPSLSLEQIPGEQIQFYSYNKRTGESNWSIGTYRKTEEGFWKLTFSRVSTFLGHNVYVEDDFTDGNISFSKKYRRDNNKKAFVLEYALSHEYQFKETYLEQVVSEIFSKGWDEKKVKILLRKYAI